MSIRVTDLFINVAILILLVVPGFLFERAGKSTPRMAKGLSNLVLYAAQPALIVSAYIRPFDADILVRAAWVAGYSILAHILFYGIACLIYRKRGDNTAQVRALRYATVFTNAGYMGIPLITMLCGGEAAIYASVYVAVFNIFCWTLGCFIYTEDPAYMSPRSAVMNPSFFAIAAGLVCFLTPLGGLLCKVRIVTGVIEMLQSTVAPLAMFIIGMGLAHLDLRRAFLDSKLYLYLVVRMLLSPALVWAIMRLVALTGIGMSDDTTVITVMLLLSATPAATATAMFAEKFDGDSSYAGKLVALSTILAVGTMPLVALLLKV